MHNLTTILILALLGLVVLLCLLALVADVEDRRPPSVPVVPIVLPPVEDDEVVDTYAQWAARFAHRPPVEPVLPFDFTVREGRHRPERIARRTYAGTAWASELTGTQPLVFVPAGPVPVAEVFSGSAA